MPADSSVREPSKQLLGEFRSPSLELVWPGVNHGGVYRGESTAVGANPVEEGATGFIAAGAF